MNIYVGNLSYQISDEQLRDAFKGFGEVESARIITDRESGRSKGFGFVDMPERKQAMAAIEGLGGTILAGRPLTVNEARPRPARNHNHRDGGYNGGGGRRGNASGSGYNSGGGQRGNASGGGYNKRY